MTNSKAEAVSAGELADKLDSALALFLGTVGEYTYSGPRIQAVRQLEKVLWDNKNAILAALRAAIPETEGAGRDDLGIVLSALRYLEDAVGEKFDDEDGVIAAIERGHITKQSGGT